MKYQVKNKIKLSDTELEAIAHLRTYRWLFKQILSKQGREQSATGIKHQGNDQRRREPCR